jgi:hypothetical protein
MIGDLERIKRVGAKSVKARMIGSKKKFKKVVQPQRIGATHVQRDVSKYDRMVESIPIVEPPLVDAISLPDRVQEDIRLQQLEMKVSSMGEDISTMSRDIAKLVSLLAPGAGAGGRQCREAVPGCSSDERPKTPPKKKIPDPVGVQASKEPGTFFITASNPDSKPDSKPEGEIPSVSFRCGRESSPGKAEACVN